MLLCSGRHGALNEEAGLETAAGEKAVASEEVDNHVSSEEDGDRIGQNRAHALGRSQRPTETSVVRNAPSLWTRNGVLTTTPQSK